MMSSRYNFYIKTSILLYIIILFSIFFSYSFIANGSEKNESEFSKTYNQTEMCDLNSIVYGKNLFVAVGDDGRISTSRDAVDWKNEKTITDKKLNSILFTKDLFVAAGDFGEIITSTDGLAWKSSKSNVHNNIMKIVYGKNSYVAITVDGFALTSKDGKVWAKQEVAKGVELVDIVTNGTIFVAIGKSSIYTSRDGKQWSNAVAKTKVQINSVIWDKKRFICKSDKNITISSKDAVVWNIDNIENIKGKMKYLNDSYFVIGGDGISISRAYNPKNKVLNLDYYKDVNDIAWGNDRYVMVCNHGEICFSSSGSDWDEILFPIESSLSDVAYGNGKFISVGKNGKTLISSNGVDWTTNSIKNIKNLVSIIFAKNKFYTVASNGKLFSSTNGDRWNQINYSKSKTSDVNKLVYFENSIYILGETTYISKDGVNWETNDSSLSINFTDIAYFDKKWIAVNTRGEIYSSIKQTKWDKIDIKYNDMMKSLATNKNTLVIAGNRGLYTLTNDKKWVKSYVANGFEINKVQVLNNNFFAFCENGVLLSSKDGLKWNKLVSNTSNQLTSMTINGAGTMVLVGSQNTILSKVNYSNISQTKLNNAIQKNINRNATSIENSFLDKDEAKPNNGYVVSKDNQVYFSYLKSSKNKDYYLIKIDNNLGAKTILNKDNAQFLTIYKDNLFYINETKQFSGYNPKKNMTEIVKTNLDGSGRTVLLKGVFSGLKILNDRIYFGDDKLYDKKSICSANIDGSNLKVLARDCQPEDEDFIVSENGIYYSEILYFPRESDSDRKFGYSLIHINKDGTGNTIVFTSETKISNIKENSQYVFFMNAGKNKIMMLNKENNSVREFVSSEAEIINYQSNEEYVYYISGNCVIKRASTDGTENIELIRGPDVQEDISEIGITSNLTLEGDYLYFSLEFISYSNSYYHPLYDYLVVDVIERYLKFYQVDLKNTNITSLSN